MLNRFAIRANHLLAAFNRRFVSANPNFWIARHNLYLRPKVEYFKGKKTYLSQLDDKPTSIALMMALSSLHHTNIIEEVR